MKAKQIYGSEAARQKLLENGLVDFDSLWTLDAGWFEAPNQRRGGWSGVSRYQLKDGDRVFIKRQQNHFFRSWRHFFRAIPTFTRELSRILGFELARIPALELVYFGQREFGDDIQSILVTRELAGFKPLDSSAFMPLRKLAKPSRQALIEEAAAVVRHMHNYRYQHNCLYPKHIFVKFTERGTAEVRLIDLEKVKWRPAKRFAMLRDLGTLHRHAEGWTATDKLRFFLAYRQETRLSSSSKRVLRKILRGTHKKMARRS
jgi:hypothetical protein